MTQDQTTTTSKKPQIQKLLQEGKACLHSLDCSVEYLCPVDIKGCSERKKNKYEKPKVLQMLG